MSSTSQLFIKGNWTLPYTFERINQALHRAPDDPLPTVPHMAVCGIGKAINTVAILHNLIREKAGAEWQDYAIENLDTSTVTNTEKARTQLSFRLRHTGGAAATSDSDSSDASQA
jgi:hypothetical protein